jgi:hypothetical protein
VDKRGGNDDTGAKILGEPEAVGERYDQGSWERGTYSNMACGMWSTRERWATMGKVAAKELVAQMMKTEAMRRPVNVVAPPPEPQLSLSEDMLEGGERTGLPTERVLQA